MVSEPFLWAIERWAKWLKLAYTPSVKLVIIRDQPYMSELRFSFSIEGETTKLNGKKHFGFQLRFLILFPTEEPFNIRADLQVSFDARTIHFYPGDKSCSLFEYGMISFFSWNEKRNP